MEATEASYTENLIRFAVFMDCSVSQEEYFTGCKVRHRKCTERELMLSRKSCGDVGQVHAVGQRESNGVWPHDITLETRGVRG